MKRNLTSILDTPAQTILWHAYQHVNQMFLTESANYYGPLPSYRAAHHALSILLDAMSAVNGEAR